MTSLRSITACPGLSVRRVNKLEKHVQAYANCFVSWFRAGDHFTPIVKESMIPDMCAGMCEATITRARDKTVTAEQVKYARACAKHWCVIFLKMTA